jgi:hypothetical protein
MMFFPNPSGFHGMVYIGKLPHDNGILFKSQYHVWVSQKGKKPCLFDPNFSCRAMKHMHVHGLICWGLY